MPSPLGHALGGIAAGVAAGGAMGGTRWPSVGRLAAFASLGVAADLDLLFGTHSTCSHSLGAVGVVAALAFVAGRGGRVGWRPVAAVAAAYASHLLLDWVNTDYAAPIGIMALWPMTTAHYHAGLSVFPPVSREVGAARFLATNAWAALVEVLVLGPVALGVVVARARQHVAPHARRGA